MANDESAAQKNCEECPSNMDCALADGKMPDASRMRELSKVYLLLAQDLNTWHTNHPNAPAPASSADVPAIYRLHEQVGKHQDAPAHEKPAVRAEMNAIVEAIGATNFAWREAEVENLQHLMLYYWSRELAPYNKPADAAPNLLFW